MSAAWHSATSSARGVCGVMSAPTAAETAGYSDTRSHSPDRSCSVPSAWVTVSDPNTATAASWMSARVSVGPVVVVGISLVELQHPEFRGMGGVGPFVAEVAVDVEHPLDSAHHAPLEEQLRRDAQEQVDVIGIHVGNERTRARPALQVLQDRGLDLEEVPVGQRLTQTREGRDPLSRHGAGLFAHDQIDVTLPDTVLLAEWLVGHRQRAQATWRQNPTRPRRCSARHVWRPRPRRAPTRGRPDRRRPSSRPATARRPGPGSASPVRVCRLRNAGWRSTACRCCG